MPASPEGSRRRKPASTNEALRAVAHEHRRQVLYHLRDSYDVATVDELTTHLSTTMEMDTEETAIQLHHRILPQLVKAELVTVGREPDQVQYVGGSFETALIDWLRHRKQ